MKWTLILSTALLTSINAQANECGKVTIADMNWNSASLIANIDRFILEKGYGCDAELVLGDNVPTATSMVEKGEPDIAPEVWTNSIKDTVDAGVAEGKIKLVGNTLLDGGQEGFWVPGTLVEKYPELKTIEGIKQHPELFPHPEKDDVGAFYSCPAGWQCQTTNQNLFDVLGLEEAGFELIDPGSSAGLSGALAKSLERGEGWFGYYWAPTPILGKYNLVNVDFGHGVDEDAYLNCMTKEDCTELTPTMYPPSPAYAITTDTFAKENPAITEYLSKRGFRNEALNELLAWMEDEQANGEDTMYYFLQNYPQTWKQWVPKDVAEKVSSNL
ncbi:ABC transporter substrate-binding protein [Vibrio sp. RC27]